ncbi:hypothetical protein GCE9029_01210 [Grimontia celer]|uniref:Uncharacterized protein n=1 Tax=Grimontia celer TaxID=1796497 RepID=A0A128EXY9_9GAMM|nr:hypothetical protein GCE9029_01210 [Grimontia celer]
MVALLLTVFISIAYAIYTDRTNQQSVELIRGVVKNRVTMLTEVGNKHWLVVSVPPQLELIKVRLPKGYPIKVGSEAMLQKIVYDDTGGLEYKFLRYVD